MIMYRWILVLMSASALVAADEQRLALSLKAQMDFDRVQLAAAPDLRDTLACVQTQASLLPVATLDELPVSHYRKGFCTLASATITRNANEFRDAAAEFDKTIEGWDARPRRDKNKPPEPLPPAVSVLAVVASLNAGWDDSSLEQWQAQLTAFTEKAACGPSSLIPEAFCKDALQTGRQWLGWMSLRHERLDDAARYFAGSTGTGWPEWVDGRKAFLARRYADAASLYRQGIDLQKRERTSLLGRLGPRADLPAELTDLGGALLLAGNRTASIAALDEAVKSNPTGARALYLRARAKELSRQTDAAMADYNLASRAAFANAKDLASGEAHLYRGILLYRRKDYTQAEAEFSSALNFDISAGLRNDATAWRHLSAVASGSCAASAQYLERSLSSVSPYFPVDEARSAVAACPPTASAGARGN